jgi:hypothetical protein
MSFRAMLATRALYTHHAQTERLCKLTELICMHIGRLPMNLDVMIESPAYGAPGRAADMAQLHGAVRSGLARDYGIWPMYAEALAVRRIVLGTGCKKNEAEEKVREFFKLEFPTPDECDAYLLMRTAEIAATPTDRWMLPDIGYLVTRLRVRNG